MLLYRVRQTVARSRRCRRRRDALLFFPSLFMWSVSALKESPFLTATALTLVAAVACRERGRRGGFAAAAIGLVGGSVLAAPCGPAACC